MFIIRRTDQGGGYVAPSGSRSSYTRDPRQAQQYPTRAAAERDRCPENEVIHEYFSEILR